MKIKKQKIAVLPDGKKIHLFTISNGEMSFSATDYGCTITSIILPSKTGKKDDIVLGFPSIESYMKNWTCFFGVFVGRFANRIGGASFTLNGNKYELDDNDGGNTLHGGFHGYNRMKWHAEIIETQSGSGISFTRTSPDGEQGFPGTVSLEVLYLLNDNNELTMRYRARTDAPTPINLTNHSYFNLKGAGNGDILDQELYINASSYLEVDKALIPTGKLIPVKGTPFDFTQAKAIGKDISSVPGGYDHCFCLNKDGGRLNQCAQVKDPTSGRTMTILTNQPGVQFYAANSVNGVCGKNGDIYNKHSALCLETQQYPDFPNKPDFPQSILCPNELFEAVTVHSFGW